MKKSNTSKGYEKVSMNLTPIDMENINYLSARLNARQQVIAVSRALEYAKALIELADNNNKILVEDKDGNLQEIRFII